MSMTDPHKTMKAFNISAETYDALADRLGFDKTSSSCNDVLAHAKYRLDDNDPLWKHLNAGDITDMTDLFHGSGFANPALGHWDTSKVQSMRGMFANCEMFCSDISRWDTSNVTDMASMFANAQAFDCDISRWDTSNVTDMSFMFDDACEFNQPLGAWDLSAVTDIRGIFGGSGMSAENLSSTLIGWARTGRKGLYFSDIGAPVEKLSPQAQQVVVDMGWVITFDSDHHTGR